ncbi:hypothetical protein [Corynebacterium lowii]|uniref:Universal stress protein n=1 Tax=Corynebacterium lowii TaxID=1544413 RepID=A0A0Q0YJX3_9CORY|nr:hypothetical protein [Corynebacterium lowii]KQB87129.1 hypothetical protein Clow_00177 [Corynebacterium lowii]MDP9852285.1 hypothetical protein [Corynebacterium lowii]
MNLLVAIPAGWAHEHGEALIRGACRAAHLMGMEHIHLVATADDLPDLAIHAAAHSAELPSGFQLCQRGACAVFTEQHSVLIDAPFLLRLGRVRGLVEV